MLRQATRNDLGGVLTCLRELNQSHVDYFTKNRVKWLLKNKCVAVANHQNEITGVCVIQEVDWDCIEIFALAVHPMWQGFGVGSKLVKWAEAMARSLDKEVVFAHSYAFYEATSFYLKQNYNKQEDGNEEVYTFFKWL